MGEFMNYLLSILFLLSVIITVVRSLYQRENSARTGLLYDFTAQKIRQFCTILLVIQLMVVMAVAPGMTTYALTRQMFPPRIDATAAAVVDVETGQVLYDKNMHIKRYPASLTKVLTAIIAIEEGNLKDKVVVSRRAAYQEGSSIWLSEGEKINLEELLYGILLASGNDAAVAVAEHISGSIEEFARLMNEKAVDMGALNSHFNNPSGLPSPEHYSTAYDLAVIMRYTIKNEAFARICSTKHKTISWAGKDWGRGLRNHNKLLWTYSDITGGKTGYTRAAGRCLMATAMRNGREVVAVVLNSSNDWLEIRQLLDYGLDNYKKIRVVNKGDIVHKVFWEGSREGELKILAEGSIDLLIPSGQSVKFKKMMILKPELELPIKKGDQVGEMKIYKEEEMVGITGLLAFNDLNYNSLFIRFWKWLIRIFRKSDLDESNTS